MKKITSLIDILSAQTEKSPERVIYRFLEYKNGDWESQDITLRSLYHKSLEIAYALRKKGLRPGDRAVIFSMQDYGTTYAILGCMMAGVTFTVIPPPLDEGKIARFISVLKSCQPKALISNYALEQESGVSLTGRLIREAFTSVIRLKRIYTDRLTPYKRKDVIVTAPVAIAASSIPFVIVTLRPYFRSIPVSLDEAARLDGCGSVKAFLMVMLPAVKTGIITIMVISFLNGWNDLVYSMTFNVAETMRPLTANIYKFQSAYGTRWNCIMAYGAILVLPVILMFIFLQKYIVGGLVAGAVKD